MRERSGVTSRRSYCTVRTESVFGIQDDDVGSISDVLSFCPSPSDLSVLLVEKSAQQHFQYRMKMTTAYRGACSSDSTGWKSDQSDLVG
jgi:hypothetical protein